MRTNTEFKLPSLKDARIRTRDKVNIENTFKIDENTKSLGKDKYYFIRTYGCQANVRDSETLSGILEGLSFKESIDEAHADLIIFNTCAIRKGAEDKVIGEIGHLKKLQVAKPDTIFALCGCMAQEEEVVDLLLRKHRHVNLIFGTHNIHRLPLLLRDLYTKQEKVVEVYSKEGEVIENLPVKRDFKHKAWVNIMYGCDKFCTYCIVPYTRGKERSRLIEDIIEEVNQLVKDGCKEVTLLGQNVNAYGKDLKLDYDFSTLLEKVAQTNIERIRFSTSHPLDFTFEMADVIAKYNNIMPFIHLPVQSGNSDILKIMGRRYTREKFLALHDYIKEKVPHCTFSTDIIVGFPNETQEQFMDTLSLIDHCKFDNAFTFIYSPRVGTPAAKMIDNVTKEEKDKRLQILNEKVNNYAKENNLKYQDKVLKVLVDGISKKNDNAYSGYSEEFKLVNFKAENVNIGDIVEVKITEARSWSLNGELIEK